MSREEDTFPVKDFQDFENAFIVVDLVERIYQLREQQGRLSTTLNGVVDPKAHAYIFRQYGFAIKHYEDRLKKHLSKVGELK
jgi:hypothetical protein